jgi:hypothetical protein
MEIDPAYDPAKPENKDKVAALEEDFKVGIEDRDNGKVKVKPLITVQDDKVVDHWIVGSDYSTVIPMKEKNGVSGMQQIKNAIVDYENYAKYMPKINSKKDNFPDSLPLILSWEKKDSLTDKGAYEAYVGGGKKTPINVTLGKTASVFFYVAVLPNIAGIEFNPMYVLDIQTLKDSDTEFGAAWTRNAPLDDELSADSLSRIYNHVGSWYVTRWTADADAYYVRYRDTAEIKALPKSAKKIYQNIISGDNIRIVTGLMKANK